jgi:hypothetical protein
VVAHLARVLLEPGLARRVVGGLDGVEIGFERRLRVDDDALPARQRFPAR